MPLTLLAAMEMPMPVPQMRMPPVAPVGDDDTWQAAFAISG